MKYLAILAACLLVLPSSLVAQEEAEGTGVVTMSGMSIMGNNEAPRSLVIVPWKSSELGDGIDIGNLLDERAIPVDKEVFSRQLSYYEIRAFEAGTPAE